MELDTVVNNEVAESVADSGSTGMKTAAVVGVSMTVGAVLWNCLIKPVGRKVITVIRDRKANKRAKDGAENDVMSK